MDPVSLSAEELLAIPVDEPERLFAHDAEEARRQFLALMKRWHPDYCTEPRTADVFTHISALRVSAQKRRADGTWQTPGVIFFSDIDGKPHRARFYKRRPFALGQMYICRESVLYRIEKDYADLDKNYVLRTVRFRFGSTRMQEEIGRSLPHCDKVILAQHGVTYEIVQRPASMICLQDLLDERGPLEQRHVAWVMSRLYNLLCYFAYAGIVHGDISPTTFFIDPAQHTGLLIGGWWYARSKGEALVALPERSIAVCPPDVLAHKKADARLDRALVRLLGRELLGDRAGVTLRRNSAIPTALADWLLGVHSGTAIEEFTAWQHCLLASFGPKKFVELAITPEEIYGKESR